MAEKTPHKYQIFGPRSSAKKTLKWGKLESSISTSKQGTPNLNSQTEDASSSGTSYYSTVTHFPSLNKPSSLANNPPIHKASIPFETEDVAVLRKVKEVMEGTAMLVKQDEFKYRFLDQMKNFPDESSVLFEYMEKEKLWKAISSHSYGISEDISFFDHGYENMNINDIKIYTNPITNVTHLIARNTKVSENGRNSVGQTTSKYIIRLDKVLSKPPKGKFKYLTKQKSLDNHPVVKFQFSEIEKFYKNHYSNNMSALMNVSEASSDLNSIDMKIQLLPEFKLDSISSEFQKSKTSVLVVNYINPNPAVESVVVEIPKKFPQISKSPKFTTIIQNERVPNTLSHLTPKESQIFDENFNRNYVSENAARIHKELNKHAFIGTPLHVITGVAVLPDSSPVFIKQGVCGSFNLHKILRTNNDSKNCILRKDDNNVLWNKNLFKFLPPKVWRFIKILLTAFIWTPNGFQLDNAFDNPERNLGKFKSKSCSDIVYDNKREYRAHNRRFKTKINLKKAYNGTNGKIRPCFTSLSDLLHLSTTHTKTKISETPSFHSPMCQKVPEVHITDRAENRNAISELAKRIEKTIGLQKRIEIKLERVEETLFCTRSSDLNLAELFQEQHNLLYLRKRVILYLNELNQQILAGS